MQRATPFRCLAFKCVAIAAASGALWMLSAQQSWAGDSGGIEAYVRAPLPPHFKVEISELDGPVFADAKGHTLYAWPYKLQRVGNAGDPKGQSNCSNVKTTVNAGYMSPYPGGFTLPDPDKRPSCEQVWPPAIAPADAKPIGKWTVITRQDGRKQWAYDGAALYTSSLDRRPGDVLGGDTFDHRGDHPAMRVPIQPPPDVPPAFTVTTTRTGRLLQTERNFSVYSSDNDGPEKSNCDTACALVWIPMLAPESARPHGDWTIFEREPGLRQWAFRKKPLYRYALDSRARSLEGSDVPGWHNVFTQRSPPPPPGFTIQDTSAGQVLADSSGKTIYIYSCGEDTVDQLGCDHPGQTQAYRLAMCGGGDADRCMRTFQYVLAPKGAKSLSRSWSVIDIDPKTGRLATSGQAGSLHVWAFRERPVYTYAGDNRPGDTNADGIGEFRGEREGFKAYWLRDDFNRRAG
jgi:predicted lipoprotein with Yx(FWY)xxD motif